MSPIPRMDLTLTQEVLLAYGMQAFICLALIGILYSYSRRDQLSHLRCWTFSWVAMLTYLATAALAITSVSTWHLAASDWRRVLISTLSVATGMLQPAFVLVGVLESKANRALNLRHRSVLLGGVALVSVALVLWTAPLESRTFIRLSARHLVAGVLFMITAGMLLRQGARSHLRGPILLGWAAAFYGLGQLHGFFWLVRREVLGVVEVFPFYLGYVDALLQFFLGFGMMMWHLEAQRELTHRAMDELKESQDGLRQAQKMEVVGRLAGGVAHDFNNLMTVMYGATDELEQRHPAGTPGHAPIQDLKDALERAKSLTTQLLAFSRKQVPRPEVVDLTTVVGRQEKMLARLLGSDVRLHIAALPQPLEVMADPDQIALVLMNLIVNARDAMKNGGDVRIHTHDVEVDAVMADRLHVEPGRYAVLEVADTGSGMPAPVRDKVFEPFFTTKPVGEGTGLGLSTTYGIVRAAGGAIEIDSVLGRGTSIKILWPLTATPAAVHMVHPQALHAATLNGRVLLVEDDDTIRVLLQRHLRNQGLTVVTAADGAEALTRFRVDKAFDLLITDVIMPGLDGARLIAAVRELVPGIRILAISGYTGDLAARSLPTDVAWLQKPFSSSEFGEAVFEAMAPRSVLQA